MKEKKSIHQILWDRAYASMLLDWSRSLEEHGMKWEQWEEENRSKYSALNTPYCNPPQHTKDRI